MKIGYRNRALEKVCTKRKAAIEHLPGNIAPELLLQRLSELAAFDHFGEVPFQKPPLHFHPVRANLAGKSSVMLQSLWRIVLEPAGEFDRREDGTPIAETVTEISISSIEDYHSR